VLGEGPKFPESLVFGKKLAETGLMLMGGGPDGAAVAATAITSNVSSVAIHTTRRLPTLRAMSEIPHPFQTPRGNGIQG
jgi:hypothetical protein